MSSQPPADANAIIASHMAPTLSFSVTNTVAYRASFTRFKSLYSKKVVSVSNTDCVTTTFTPIPPPGLCPLQDLTMHNEKSPINEAFENKVRSVQSMMKSLPTSPSLVARVTSVDEPGVCVHISGSTYRGIPTEKPTTSSSTITSAQSNACAIALTTVPNKSLDCVVIPANPCRHINARQFLAFSSKNKSASRKPRHQSHLTAAVITQDTKGTTKANVLEKPNAVVVNETLPFEANSEEQVSIQTCKEALSTDIKAAVQEGCPFGNAYHSQQEEPYSQAHAVNQTPMLLECSNNRNDSVKESPTTLSSGSAIEIIAAQGDVIDAKTATQKTMNPVEIITKECTVTEKVITEKVITENSLEAERTVTNEHLLVDSTNNNIDLTTPIINNLQEIKSSENQFPTEDTTGTKQYTVLKYEAMVSEHVLHEETSRSSVSAAKILVEENDILKNELNLEDNAVLTDAPATTGDTAAPDCTNVAISETVSHNQLITESPIGQSVSTHEGTAIQPKIATDTRTPAENKDTTKNTTENHMVHINQDPAKVYPSPENSITNLDSAFTNETPTNTHNTKVDSVTAAMNSFSNPHCEESLILGQGSVEVNFVSEGLVLENEKATTTEFPTKENGPLSTKMAEVMNASTIDAHPKTAPATTVPKGLACASDFKDWLARMTSSKVSNVGINAASEKVTPQPQQAMRFPKKPISTRTEPAVGFKAAPEIVMADSTTSPNLLDKTSIPIGNVEPGEAKLLKPLQRMTFDTAGTQDPQAYPLHVTNDLTPRQSHGFPTNRPHGGDVNDTTTTKVISSPNVTVIPRSQSVSSNSSSGSGSKAKPLATAKDFEAYMQATSVFAAKHAAAGSGVFLMTKEARIELPEKYLQCMATNCQYLTYRQKCNGSHHKRCPGATPSILGICTSFVKFGICATKGASCARGVHPCPTQSRFNTCNKSNCSYLHEVTIDQFGQALLTIREPSTLPTFNDLTSLSLVTSVERRFDLEPPGTGTELGPRNDNDWRDYTKLSVLPTIDEIIPRRSTVYMPHKKMMFPLSQVLDVGFRHQREAMLGPVRDSVADVIRKIIKGDHFDMNVAEGSKNKYRVYSNAKFGQASIGGGRHAVATFSIIFPSPGQGFLKNDKVLRRGHLLAILIHSDNGFSVIWAKAMEDWSDRDEEGKCSKIGHIGITIVDEKTSERDLGTILRLRSTQKEFYLIDFAGVIPDAFMNGLFVLQQMGGKTLRFAQDLFECRIGESMFSIPPYLRHRMINLSSLGHETHNHMSALQADKRWFALMKDQLAQENSKGIIFTDGQADAILNTLSSALSCIQGPPGTGKSFVGSAIVKLLAVNRRSWSGKQTIPILLTAQTNHALDETIAAYIKCGLKVARLGIAPGKESPEPEHVQYQHHILPRDQQDIYRKPCNSAYKNREDAVHALEDLLEDVSKESLSWSRVGPYLQENHIEFFKEFTKTSGDGRAADGFNFWANNEDIDEESSLLTGLKKTIPEGLNIQTPPLAERVPSMSARSSTQKKSTCTTKEIDPWGLTAKQRKILIDNWKSILNKSLDMSVLAARATLQRCTDIYEKALVAETAAKMVNFGVDVVACTATRAAKDHYLLKKLGIEVAVVEEAGEVVESVVLPIFLPSIQHVILMGDHEQLKPYCDNRGLTGGDYNHDKSLFERLVTPNTEGEPPLARLARLDCQRRMRPEIADLVRCLGLYDKLSDGSNVQKYPHVPGMGGRNLLWVDHKRLESMSSDKSYENSYEAAMVAGHAAHLFRSGEFGIRDLVIITPYRAQVKAIKSTLAKEGSITIPVPATDIDLLSQRNSAYRRPLESAVEEITMVGIRISDAVLVTTVDNYQGQEANIIFYSAVRSNQNGRVGFTDVSNRICVTLSRARHGMYIFGNAETAREGGKWWNKAVKHMQQRGLVTDGVPLELCSRHPTQTRLVKDPSDFQRSNTCDMSCTTTLDCGHICNRKCHPEAMHSLPHFHCTSACDLFLGCGHKCGGICGAPCCDCPECKNSVGHNNSEHKPEVRLVFEMCQHNLVKADCPRCLEEDVVSNHDDWYLEFSQFYNARARSLSEGKENNISKRQIFLRSLNLSRSGLSDNIYKFGVRMSIFNGFEAAFRSGLEQAKEIEEKFGHSGLVKRVEGVKAYVNEAVEDDYSWLYKELVRLSASRNSAGMLAKALRMAVSEVLLR